MRVVGLTWLVGACVGLCAHALPARAQTWAGNRETPSLGELLTVDATGEPGWVYGEEDVAGDGVETFRAAEQGLDVRTAYAATDAQRFWTRVYLSSASAPGNELLVYVFIDRDANPNSGGSARIVEITDVFDDDPSPGGYEVVLEVRGDEEVSNVFEWNDAVDVFAPLDLANGQAVAEAGTDRDPVRLNGDVHGYLQSNVELDLVGLTTACEANIYVRSVDDMGANGGGDLDVGLSGPCHPGDDNDDGISDVAEPPDRCTRDDQCPAGGVCVDGRCVLPVLCERDADCAANESCVDGQCVADGGDTCTSDAMCDGLVCQSGECVACTNDAMCGGSRCAPNGRCASGTSATEDDGLMLAPDEKVQGGALTCAARSGGSSWAGLAGLLAAAFGLLRLRRVNP